jgi:hypothetical protein
MKQDTVEKFARRVKYSCTTQFRTASLQQSWHTRWTV